MAVDVVQEIKMRTDLVELISQYVPLRRAGSSYKGLCPFHAEKTPSFTVNPDKGFFKCWGCGEGGDCFGFLMKKEGLSFPEAGEVLAKRLGLEWVSRGDSAERKSERQRLYDICALAERFFRRSLEQSPVVKRYLEERGLLPETIADFRIGYAPPGYEALLGWLRRERVSLEDAEAADVILRRDDGGYRDRFVDRVIFPICDLEGRPVAFGGRTLQPDGIPKYLNSRETAIFRKGSTIYGMDRARKAIPEMGFGVVVEGYMDLIAMHQAGITNAVAPMGTAFTTTQMAMIARYSPTRSLVLCYDGDAAGAKAAMGRSAEFEEAGCDVRVATLPEGDDPDTFIKKHGADQMRAVLNQAIPLLDAHLNQLRRGYNLLDEGERLAFVRNAAKIIAQSGSHLTRQEYAGRLTTVLDRLSEEWYPGQPQRALSARMSLSHEVNRLLRLGPARSRYGDTPAPSAPANGAAPKSAKTLAERYLVRGMLSDERWCRDNAWRMEPEFFEDPEIMPISLALLQDDPGERVETIPLRAQEARNDPGLAGVVSDLLLEASPISEEGLESSLQLLEREWKQQRKRELLQLQEQGELGGEDPRRTELLRLMAELGGRARRED